MEIGPVYILMDYLSYSWGRENLRKAAILTNLQDFLSSYFEVVVSQMSQAITGCFTMITFCAAASTTGLMFLWISSMSSSEFHTVYIAIFLLALGKGGQNLLSDFLEERLDEKVRVGKERKAEHENTDDDNNDNKKERHQIEIIVNIWWYSAKYAGILVAFCISHFYFFNISYSNYFKLAALLVGGTALFFYFGCARYNPKSCENLPAKSDLCKIIRICYIALKKRKFRYPTLASSYYWKPYKQNQHYLYNHGQELRLLPEVPRIFGWVDKAAIIKEQYSAESDLMNTNITPQRQEKKGEPCTVKEVREMKNLVPLMQLGFTFFAYCLISASANTFFVEQVSNLRPVIIRDDITLLFIAKSIMCDLSMFIYWLLGFAFGMLRKSQVTRFKRLASAAIRIVIGMVCALICCIIARRVEVHRLSLIKKLKNPIDENISMTTMDLLPQFLLWGVTEGFLESGLTNLFYGLASKSMWGFENSFNQIVIGTGKLFTIPFIMIFSGWIKDEVNTSHLDRYYLMLAILNFVFLLAFVYVSFSIRYAYKEECPNDEDIEMDQQRMEHAREEDLEEEENETEKECSNDEETDMEHRLENIAHGENETEEECSNDEEINGMEQSSLKHAYEEENVTEENLEFGKDLYSMVGRGSIRERIRNTACDDSK